MYTLYINSIHCINLYGKHGALKLDISLLFTTFFNISFIYNIVYKRKIINLNIPVYPYYYTIIHNRNS